MVDPMNGELVLVQSLDFESRTAYTLRTTVMDGGDPTFSDSALVNISVQDINDNTPLFNASSYTAEVFEGNYTTTPLRIVTVRQYVKENGIVQSPIFSPSSCLSPLLPPFPLPHPFPLLPPSLLLSLSSPPLLLHLLHLLHLPTSPPSLSLSLWPGWCLRC